MRGDRGFHHALGTFTLGKWLPRATEKSERFIKRNWGGCPPVLAELQATVSADLPAACVSHSGSGRATPVEWLQVTLGIAEKRNN